MAGKIPRYFIDDLIARSDIVDLIDARVKLKKTGKNYSACCPFHNEKSPSFTVAPDKQFYYCFGCGAKGNAISFLMEYDNLEFVDAIEELAAAQGLEVPREDGGPEFSPEKQVQAKQDYDVMAQAAVFYQQQLKQHANSEQVIDYLKSRGLTGETVKQFQIGYAPSEWDGLMKSLGQSKQSAHQLRDLGMVIEKETTKSLYDRFRDRVMFPILDRRGKCIAFGGRIIGDGTPKYLNSPETRIYSKGRELYGLYQARQANRGLERLLVVEGYMDVVALFQAGVTYAVASLGTSTTTEQIKLMLRSTSEIVCCYDGDKAGRKAAWRTLENALPSLVDGIQIRFVFLPDGEDPDTYVKQYGKEAFEAQIAQAKDMVSFFYEHLYDEIGQTEGEFARSKLSQLAQPLLEQMPDSEYKNAIADTLSVKLKRKIDVKSVDRVTQAKNKSALLKSQTSKKITPVRIAIAILLERPSLATNLAHMSPAQLKSLAEMAEPGMSLLVEVIQFCISNPNSNAAQMLENWRGTETAQILSQLMLWEHHVQEDNFEVVFLDTMEKILTLFVTKRKEMLQTKAKMNLITAAEKQEYLALLRQNLK
ncbi:DNA primase [Catenovulum maritimum]|uniref:DNA primase n=1 Tax=Catenovulum maritimum TaxID=1513271 RepID=A0A0J8GLI3_9ALTE|nr:DNA primase [Catenovulum maritimum]KMT63660.1 DNA primase [Catenovulum maritimum]